MNSITQWRQDYPPKRLPPPSGVFELGLCMAGAVSAGAYTAGVLDLLIEALDCLAAEGERREAAGEVPLHRVRIPVLGGSSAGGMCAALATLFLDAEFPAVRPGTPAAERRRNPLYRAWVTDIDIRHLLGREDLASGEPLTSLLDSTALERIVDALLDERAGMAPRHRPWLTNPMRAVLTLANLRGIPYALSFQGSGFRHWMSHHADHVRFTVGLDPAADAAAGDPPKVGETALDRFARRGSAAREAFKAVALGTGSFPVALAPRVVERDAADYLYRAALTPTGPLRDDTVLEPLPAWAESLQPAWPPGEARYRALCVDGGAMNNEPLDLVRRVLAGYGGANPRASEEAQRALLLVDPFVNPGKPGPDSACGLVGSIMPLFNALVQNSRFKPEDLALAADPHVGSRFAIVPTRGSDWMAEGAIAAGHLSGFLGFFAQAYREHDFLLGRRNAQNFLRRHFVLPEKNPIFGEGRWSGDDRERWGVMGEGGEPPGRYLPIIPLCGHLEREEEPLPPWPAGHFRPEEVAPLIRSRAEVAVPALRDVFLAMAVKQRGVKPWLVRQATAILTNMLTPRLVDTAMAKVSEEARKLDAGRTRA